MATLLGLSDRPNNLPRSNQNTLERRTGLSEALSDDHMNPRLPVQGKSSLAALNSPWKVAVDKLSTCPVLSWVQQMRMQLYSRDANFRTLW